MPNGLTTTSPTSRPLSLFAASNDYASEALHGRCDQGRLVDGLRDLLGLYYQPAETPEQRAREIALYVQTLADMSDDCVGFALAKWRMEHDRRPSPAGLRQLCMMRRQEAVRRLGLDRPAPTEPLENPPPTPEARIRVKRMVDAYKTASVAADPEPKRRPHWSETAAPDDPRFATLAKARAKLATPEHLDQAEDRR